MKYKNIILCFFCFLFVPAFVLAESVEILDGKQFLIEQNLRQQETALANTISPSALSGTCLQAPLPVIPKTPNYTINATDAANEGIKLIFWHEKCRDNTGWALLVRAIPTSGTPFFCSSSFKVVQNAVQINAISLQTAPNASGWCDDMLVPATMILDSSGIVQFDPAKAMTLFYEPLAKPQISLAIGGAVLPAPAVSGNAAGYKSFTHTCTNVTTGVNKTYPSQTDPDWNCKGLALKRGQTVRTTITGVVK